MKTCTHRWALLAALFVLPAAAAHSQVFVVGEKTATADIDTGFKPTDLPLPDGKLNERGRRELVRNLEAEQGFAHRALPIAPNITLHANGKLTPGGDEYRHLIFEKGQAAAAGDRVIITSLTVKPDRIIFDLNGGPYAKHRFLSHVQINDSNVVANNGERPTGSRITLVFEGQVPDISAPEIKALLEPLIDFGVKSSEQAYADTLPAPLKDAIAAHDVLVGMTHRMVLAALGAPDSKVREQPSGDPNGARYEEWIYGHVPQTVRFVRFVGDRVTIVEIAALGKPIEIHDKDEMAGYKDPADTREVAMGDRRQDDPNQDHPAAPPPTLRKPGEAAPTTGMNRVQYPVDKPAADKPAPDTTTQDHPAATPTPAAQPDATKQATGTTPGSSQLL